MSTETPQDPLKTFNDENKLRIEVRMAVLEAIKAQASQFNSASVKLLAEAYAHLGGVPQSMPSVQFSGTGFQNVIPNVGGGGRNY